jgi:hypothetical protein
MGRTKELLDDVFNQQIDARLQYEEMIYQFNKKIYEDYFNRSVGSSEE